MEGNGEVQGKRKGTRALRRAARRAVRPHAYSHPFELRRKAVQLCLEEGFPVKQVAHDLGVGFSTLGTWVRRYRAQGEAGLQAKVRPRSPRPQVAAAVKRQALELKRRQPDFGIQKISQFLRRDQEEGGGDLKALAMRRLTIIEEAGASIPNTSVKTVG